MWACAAVVAALLATFQVDRVTGSAPFQHLYYVPIVFGAFSLGWRGGLTTALAAIVLYHLANPVLLTFRYEQADVVQITLFIAIGLVTARLTADARRLRAQAEAEGMPIPSRIAWASGLGVVWIVLGVALWAFFVFLYFHGPVIHQK